MPEVTDNETKLICAVGELLRTGNEICNSTLAGADSERRMVFRIDPELYVAFAAALRQARDTLRAFGESHA